MRTGISIVSSILVVVGVTVIFIPYYAYRPASYRLDKKNLVKLTHPLAEDPVIRKANGKNPSYSLVIHLKEHAGVDFKANDLVLDAADTSAIFNDLKIGDTITITVNKRAYEEGFTRKSEYSGLERALKSEFSFEFYSLRFRGREYIDESKFAFFARERRNKLLLNNAIWGGTCILLYLIAMATSRYRR